MEDTLDDLARRSAAGSKAALEQFVRRIKDDVYGLAMRMLGHPSDAEDATQEILLKVVTSLGGFRGESSIRTWIWRIASNHVVSTRRGRKEPEGLSFEALEGMLKMGLAAGEEAGADQALLAEEVKLGCTQAMLMCLDREHRLAYLLGEVFELPGEDAAAVLEIEPAAFRKRLSRARQRMVDFMTRTCGHVSEAAPCRCARQIGPSVQMGLLDPSSLVYAVHPRRASSQPELWRHYRAIDDVDRSLAVLRSHPDHAAPDGVLDGLRQLLAAQPS